MVDSVDPLRHQHCFLLIRHRFRMFTHNIIQSCNHPQTLRNLRMHRPVHVIQQIQRLADQLEAVLQEPLLDLALARRVEIVGVRSPRIYMLDDREYIEDVLFEKHELVFRVQVVVPQKDLQAGFDAKRTKKRSFLEVVSLGGGLDVRGKQVVVEVGAEFLFQLRPEGFWG